MRRYVSILLLLCTGFIGSTAAGEHPSKWKVLRIEHFKQMPGVDFSQEELNSFNDALRKRLASSDIAGQVVDADAVVSPSDTAESVSMEGMLTAYDTGGAVHWPKLDAQVNLYRVSDHQLIRTVRLETRKFTGGEHGKRLGEGSGRCMANEIKKAVKEIPPLATFAPAASEQTGGTVAIAGAVQSAPVSRTENAPAKPIEAAIPTGVVAQRHAMPYRCAVVKQITVADGIEFYRKLDPPHTLALANDEIRSYLTKKAIVMQAVAEGSPMSAADADDCIVIEGRITHARWVFHTMSSPPEVTMEIAISRCNDHAPIANTTPILKMLGGWFSSDEKFAQTLGVFVEESVKKALK